MTEGRRLCFPSLDGTTQGRAIWAILPLLTPTTSIPPPPQHGTTDDPCDRACSIRQGAICERLNTCSILRRRTTSLLNNT